MTNLITKNIWSELTRAVSKSRIKSIAAVAYFGQNASKMLPLSKGSKLLIDASISALKNGQTCPDELLKLYYKGVHIFSMERLHTKLFLIGKTLYCGSANVSGNSANKLKEVLLKTTDRKVITDAKRFIESFCIIELGEKELIQMRKYYRTPKFFGNLGNGGTDNTEFHICKLVVRTLTDEEIKQSEKGRIAAEKNRINRSRHKVDDFVFSRQISFKEGDNILQIINEDKKSYVSPIGKLIHVRKWGNGNKIKFFCFVEVPDKRRKRLEVVMRKLNDHDLKSIQRAGKKDKTLEVNIARLWK